MWARECPEGTQKTPVVYVIQSTCIYICIEIVSHVTTAISHRAVTVIWDLTSSLENACMKKAKAWGKASMVRFLFFLLLFFYAVISAGKSASKST